MGLYLMLVALLPAALWLHERFDTVVLVTLARIAGLVDVVPFRYDLPAFGLLNMIVVWGVVPPARLLLRPHRHGAA